MSPAIDFLLNNKQSFILKNYINNFKLFRNTEINVLLTGVSDIRHILKTCADHAANKE